MKDGNNFKLPFQMANVISWEMAANHSLIFTSGYLGNWSIFLVSGAEQGYQLPESVSP
jgi:hypothetical protein